MTHLELLQQLIIIIKEFQRLSGYDDSGITEETVPLNDIEEFDSVRAEEVMSWVEDKFDCKLGKHADYFYSASGATLNIRDIAARLLSECAISGGESNE